MRTRPMRKQSPPPSHQSRRNRPRQRSRQRQWSHQQNADRLCARLTGCLVFIREALNNEVRADSRRFWLRRKFWKCGNTGCISHFQNCADGAKDSLFSRNRIVQSFPRISKKQTACRINSSASSPPLLFFDRCQCKGQQGTAALLHHGSTGSAHGQDALVFFTLGG